MTANKKTRTEMMESALEYLRKAIELLDQAEAPGQVAAHVDLAANQLVDAIADTCPTNVWATQSQLRTLSTS